jgi:hypothetical protein
MGVAAAERRVRDRKCRTAAARVTATDATAQASDVDGGCAR